MAKTNAEKEAAAGMEIPCPKCMKPMHMAARRCPNCMYEFADDEVRANIASKKNDYSGCIAIFVGLAVLFLIGTVIFKTGNESQNEPAVDASNEWNEEKEYGYREAAKLVVREQLRDPDSAIFSDMTVYPETGDRATIICGYVNSRNGFGGMTGPQRFIAGGTVMIEEKFTDAQMTAAWIRFCN